MITEYYNYYKSEREMSRKKNEAEIQNQMSAEP